RAPARQHLVEHRWPGWRRGGRRDQRPGHEKAKPDDVVAKLGRRVLMVDIASFRFNDPGRAFDDGYGRVNALRTDRARLTAGNALTGGDYGGAANALYGAGELEVGSRVQGMGETRQAAAAKATKDREKEVLDFTGEMAGRLSTILD